MKEGAKAFPSSIDKHTMNTAVTNAREVCSCFIISVSQSMNYLLRFLL